MRYIRQKTLFTVKNKRVVLLLRRRSLKQTPHPTKWFLKGFAAEGRCLPTPTTPACSSAGAEDLQYTAAVHEQMKIVLADVSLPVTSWGGLGCETCSKSLRPPAHAATTSPAPHPKLISVLTSGSLLPGCAELPPAQITQEAQGWALASFLSFWPINLYFGG